MATAVADDLDDRIIEDEDVALTLAYLAELDRLGDLVADAIREVFDGFGTYDRAQLAEFIAEARPQANAGAAEAADLTSAYLAELTNTTPAAVDFALTEMRLDAPFLRMWHNMKNGMPWEEARDAGASQAEMLGEDVTRQGANDYMANVDIDNIGWRRTLHPGACEWCQVVATQLYRTIQSGTFGHHACRCIPPIPVLRDLDPTAKINAVLLKDLRSSGAVSRVSVARERSRVRERSSRVLDRSRERSEAFTGDSQEVRNLFKQLDL